MDAVRQSWMTSQQWEREPTAEEGEPRELMDEEEDEARAAMGKEDEGEEEEEWVEAGAYTRPLFSST